MKPWLAVAVLAGVGATVYAAGQMAKEPRSAVELTVAEPEEVEGVVDSVDWAVSPAMLSLRVNDGKTLLLSLDPQETILLLGGKVAPVKELMSNQRVKVLFRKKEGREVASSIVVLSPPLSFPPPTPEVVKQ